MASEAVGVQNTNNLPVPGDLRSNHVVAGNSQPRAQKYGNRRCKGNPALHSFILYPRDDGVLLHPVGHVAHALWRAAFAL